MKLVLLATAAAVAVIVTLGIVFRRSAPGSEAVTRLRLQARLRRDDPRVTLGPVEDGYCTVDRGEGEPSRTCVENLHRRLVEAGGHAERTAVLETWVAAMNERNVEPVASALRPLLVPSSFPDSARAQGVTVVHREIPALDLTIAYVFDRPSSIAYVRLEDLAKLSMDEQQLHDVAMANLAGTMPVRELVEGARTGNLVRVAGLDGYDAARLLLLPSALASGESIAAVIPDRDTLAIMSAPKDWGALEDLARTPLGDRLLLDRPVEVTSEGFVLR